MVESMSIEILEAINEYYKDDVDTLIGCLVYLNNGNLRYMKNLASEELERNNLCQFCGEPLEVVNYKEWHEEVGCYEPMTYMYCKNCDID